MIDNFGPYIHSLGVLYYLAIGFGPYILLLSSIYFLLRGYRKASIKSILISFLLFLPDLLALLFLELESILYVFLLLPIFQVLLYAKIKQAKLKLS